MSVAEIMALVSVDMDASKVVQGSNTVIQALDNATKKGSQSTDALATAAEKSAVRITKAQQKLADATQKSSKQRATSSEYAASAERKAAAQVEVETAKGQNIQKRISAESIKASARTQEAIIRSNVHTQKQAATKQLQQDRIDGYQKLADTKIQATKDREIRMVEARKLRQDEARLDSITARAVGGNAAMRQRVQDAIGGQTNADARSVLRGQGMTLTEAYLAQLKPAVGDDNARFLATGRGGATLDFGAKDHEAIKRTRVEMRALQKDANQVHAAIRRAMLAPVETQAQVKAALTGVQNQMARMKMVAAGMIPQQAMAQQLQQAGFGAQAATFLAGGGGARPPSLGGGPQQTGGWMQRAGGFIRGAGVALGVGVGAYAIGNVARGAVADVERATAYERQNVAAVKLAGSQERLNQLLREYEESSGGVVDKSTALANTTRLMATGFANSVEELEKFVRATRGASIAMAKPQDYVIQETQLAISNTSWRRLDQIGLGISEVRDRVRALREENKGMTREAAFQIAVVDAMNEKYGGLADSIEGQASGVEKLTKAWSDLRLEIGQAIKPAVDNFSEYLAGRIDSLAAGVDRGLRWGGISTGGFGFEGQTYGQDWFGGNRGPTYNSRGLESQGSLGGAGSIPEVRDYEREQAIEDAKTAWYKAGLAIEERMGQEMVNATEQYGRQRANTIEQYEKQIARGAEDFAKQRARAEEDYQKSIADVHEQALRVEEDQTAQYNKSMFRARRDHENQLNRAAEDFDRQRSDRLDDYEERVAEHEESQAERIAELRENSSERLVELEKQHNDRLAEAARAHKESIENAAARFDARSIYEEQRRFAREQAERVKAREEQNKEEKEKLEEATSDAIEEFNKRLREEAKSFDKQERRAQEAYDRQVEQQNEHFNQQMEDAEEDFQEQRNATMEQQEQRLQDMADDFAERKLREDADRAETLTRMAEDHRDQLEEMDTQHGLRITQIQEQGAKEREVLNTEFEHQLGELQLQTEDWYAEQDQLVEDAIEAFDEWWEHTVKTLQEQKAVASIPVGFDTSITDGKTDEELITLYRNYEEKMVTLPRETPERDRAYDELYYIGQLLKARGIDPKTGVGASVSALSGISMGQEPMAGTSSMSSTNTSYGGNTFVVGNGAVVVHGAPGQSEEALGMIVEERLIKALERAAVAYA